MTDDRGKKEHDLPDELADLRRGPQPPPWLESRVVESLRRDGLIRSGSRRAATWVWILGLATACALAFAAGVLIKSLPSRRLPKSGNLYVLLLTRSDEVTATGSSREQDLVEEYAAWAKRERRRGVLVNGEKLGDSALALSGQGGREEALSRDSSLGGYFVIAAPDMKAAAAIARTCPHLEHGGTVVIRRVEPTP